MEDDYNLPIDLLNKKEEKINKKEIIDRAAAIQKTLYLFGADGEVVNVSVGNLMTRYCVQPAVGTKIKTIKNLKQDLQYALGAERIELNVDGRKQIIAIDIPNKKPQKLCLGNCIDKLKDETYKIPLIIGQDLNGEIVVEDLTKLPNLLITGTTGTGKSNLLSSFVIDILYHSVPKEVKLALIDTRATNFTKFNEISHLLIPTVIDSRRATSFIAWLIQESYNRNNLFAKKNVDDFDDYNAVAKLKLPRIVAMIEDFYDLVSGTNGEIEVELIQLINISRKVGINIIISTVRPSREVITGQIKVNIPARLTFKVASQIDSRTVIDVAGAEDLLTQGDILFIKTGEREPKRIQTPYISDEEIEKIVAAIKNNNQNEDIQERNKIVEEINTYGKDQAEEENKNLFKDDPLIDEAINYVIREGQASTSIIQRRFKVGYKRAGRIIDQMEERGIISGYYGSKPRKVLINKDDESVESDDNIECKENEDKEEQKINVRNQVKQKKLINKDSIFGKWWFWVLSIIFIYIVLKNL